MCDKGLFDGLEESIFLEVKFGKIQRFLSKERKINTKLNNGEQNWIGDAFYVPRLHQNLMSFGQLYEKG